jgi:hypothetical protein
LFIIAFTLGTPILFRKLTPILNTLMSKLRKKKPMADEEVKYEMVYLDGDDYKQSSPVAHRAINISLSAESVANRFRSVNH